MARRRSDDGEAVSLFPFLSILACLIGVLTLMITALALGQMDREQTDDVVARYEQYTELQASNELDRNELENLRRLLAEAEQLRKQLAAALEEAQTLETQQEDMLGRSDSASAYAKLLAESNRLRKRLAELAPEAENLDKLIAELEEEVRKRNAGPEEAVVQIRPGGSGVDIDPTFVECTATGLAVHEGDEPQRILRGDIAKEDGEFRKLLERVSAKPKGQIVFLIRPDAVGTYNTARNVARSHYGPNGYCRNGKLPVPTQGDIDLSIFRR